MAIPHIFGVLLIAKWLRNVRSAGLIVVGLADNSVVPMPGSMDVLTIWLAASQRQYWLYYAAVATASAVGGGYLTYAIARKQGKDYLQRRLSARRAKSINRRFERWGFWAVAVPAVLPPPFPMVPFLLAAGALQYPPKQFVGALALGRGVRFTILAALGALYGNVIAAFFAKYYKPAVVVLVGLSVISGSWALFEYYRQKKSS